ncbi:SMC5-SMC6 complex localization factor protein 2-like isoform X2 [Corythoichthys intestinalis]|nr:SMC5-SMC6 complex localization factor protein 2-like isoform X2 [Corythoichthys intestinalis]
MQRIVLQAEPSLLKLHVTTGMFELAFGFRRPCPALVSQFFFKMMSVHSEWGFCEMILRFLCETAQSASRIKKRGNNGSKVWVPTLADITFVLMNMGVSFVALFPSEELQPPFTEGDILMNVHIQSERRPGNKTNISPEHNCNNIFAYLSEVLSLCPTAYEDCELLLLLTMLARVALNAKFITMGFVKIDVLVCVIANNVRDWDSMLPKICVALANVTDDHHNMCYLIRQLPNSHQFIRQHLSLCMISKLIDGTCVYQPPGTEINLAALRPYVRRMQPSFLRRLIPSACIESSSDDGAEEDDGSMEEQAYYLCHSLLTLTYQACNFQSLPVHQKDILLALSSDLKTLDLWHIGNCEKRWYRCKVKNQLSGMYTEWELVLHLMKPLHLFTHYSEWRPNSMGTFPHRCEVRGINCGTRKRKRTDDGAGPVPKQQ